MTDYRMTISDIFHLRDGRTILVGWVADLPQGKSIPRCLGTLMRNEEEVCALDVYSEEMFDPPLPSGVERPRAVAVSGRPDLGALEVQKGGYALVLHLGVA